jgi:hypothetical protein
MCAIRADAVAVLADLSTATLVAAGAAIVWVVMQVRAVIAKGDGPKPERQAVVDLRTTGLIRPTAFVVAAAVSFRATELGRLEGRGAAALHARLAAMFAFTTMIVDTRTAVRALCVITRFKIPIIFPAHLEFAGCVKNLFATTTRRPALGSTAQTVQGGIAPLRRLLVALLKFRARTGLTRCGRRGRSSDVDAGPRTKKTTDQTGRQSFEHLTTGRTATQSTG